jgi:hypothetical protein
LKDPREREVNQKETFTTAKDDVIGKK